MPEAVLLLVAPCAELAVPALSVGRAPPGRRGVSAADEAGLDLVHVGRSVGLGGDGELPVAAGAGLHSC